MRPFALDDAGLKGPLHRTGPLDPKGSAILRRQDMGVNFQKSRYEYEWLNRRIVVVVVGDNSNCGQLTEVTVACGFFCRRTLWGVRV